MHPLILASYAKINLGLSLIRKRSDGYHDILTVFQQIDLKDRLTFQKCKSTRITSDNPDIPLDSSNLVHRAYEVFRFHASVSGGIHVHIEKSIPMGAGLGGGSSNAAAALAAANKLWGSPLSLKTLQTISVEIGSDVPFFLLGGAALGQGRGEILSPLNWSGDFWIVLLFPGIHVSTAWAYEQARITLTKDEKFVKFRALFKSYAPHILKDQLVNDFEDVVFQRHPVLKELKEQLYQKDAFYASMSGSGSTLFGLFESRRLAEEANTFFSRIDGITAHLCQPISIPPLDGLIT